jgi:hypothetical protein
MLKNKGGNHPSLKSPHEELDNLKITPYSIVEDILHLLLYYI